MAAALDIIVVRHPDGTLCSSDWRVVFRSAVPEVRVSINGTALPSRRLLDAPRLVVAPRSPRRVCCLHLLPPRAGCRIVTRYARRIVGD